MELVQGGELFEYLLDRGPLPEDVAVHILRQIMGAITYMHDRGVVHRDLKAENLLVVDPQADYPTVKLIDFGFSTILRHNLTGSFLGTGGYLAPEIRQQRLYSESVDIWACGVLLYMLLSCRLPFNADVEVLPSNRQQVERKFELSFPETIWQSRSESVKDLLRRMLVTDPLKRFSAHQVIRHPWTLYGPAADARTNTNNKTKAAAAARTAASASKPPPGKPKRKTSAGDLYENPQESSGYGNSNGNPTPTTGLLRSSMAAAAAAQGEQQQQQQQPMAIPPPHPTGADGSMRHARSSMNLDRMLVPVNTIMSRTPPTVKRAPLRPATTMGGSNKLGFPDDGSGPPSRNSSGGGGGGRRRMGGQQKPVLVSYFPQTLHNSVAGDLSSTSNLSLKFAMNNQKAPPMTHQRTAPAAPLPAPPMPPPQPPVAVKIVGVGR